MKKNVVDNLTPKQEEAILALLRETSIAKAAKSCKVGERTLHRWLDDPDFSKAYRKARWQAFSQAIALTQRYAPLAVSTLATLMADKDTPAHARVTAATAILKFGREGIELDDLAARVEQLEQAAETREASGRNEAEPGYLCCLRRHDAVAGTTHLSTAQCPTSEPPAVCARLAEKNRSLLVRPSGPFNERLAG